MSYTATFSSSDSNGRPYTMNSFTVSSNYTTANNYYAQINTSVYTVNTSITTFNNNHVGLGGGGNSTGEVSTNNGGHGIVVNSGITITNLYNLVALLGGGAGGDQYGSGQGGPGGGGGGGGVGLYATNSYTGGGNGGSLLSSSQLPSIVYPSTPASAGYGGAGGGPGQAGETSYPNKPAGGGGGNGINYGTVWYDYFLSATDGTTYQSGQNSGGGGYGGGNSVKTVYRYGGGGGGGGYITNVNNFGRGGYSIYNTGTITNLYNVQGGSLNIYGPLIYGGTLPTNYYVRLNSISEYGQLYCIGWSWLTPANGDSMNIFIDPASSHNGTHRIYANAFSGFTFTTLPRGEITLNGTLYYWTLKLQTGTGNVYSLIIGNYKATISSTDINSNAYTMNSFILSSNYNTVNNYYAHIDRTLYTVKTNITTFTNNHIGLGGGGNAGNNGGHGILVNSGITITNLYNLNALLGGGAGGDATLDQFGGPGGHGGPGGGGGAGSVANYIPPGYTTIVYVGGGNGGSLLNSSQINSLYYTSNPAPGYGGGGGGPSQAGETSYPNKPVGGGGGSGINYGGYFNAATNGNTYIVNNTSGGGGYGGGYSVLAGSRYGGGGGGGGYGRDINTSRGGYSIYNTGTITNLYNVQGGQNIYGPLFYGGTLPTNYYIRLNTISNYGQLYCIGWSWPTIPNGNSMNIFIDPASTHNSGSAVIYLNVFSGFTFTTLPSGSIILNGTLYYWNVLLQTTNVYRLYINTSVYTDTIKNTSATISSAFYSGIYRHVAMTISGNTHTLYFDGSAVAINTTAGNLFSTYSSISQLFIGSSANLSLGYTGFIDDFKIWNRALTDADISSIYLASAIPFNPSSVPGLSLWLDASTRNTLTISGNNVTAWNDLTGNTNLSNTANYPTYSATGLNGKPAISFAGDLSGAQKLINSSPPALYNFLSSFSFFAVLKNIPSNTVRASFFSIFSNFIIFFYGQNTDVVSMNPWFYNNNPPTFSTNSSSNGRIYIDNATILIRVKVIGVSLTVDIYGTNGIYTNTMNFTVGTGAGTCSQIIIGTSGYNIENDNFKGLISEILFYNSNLTFYQIQQIEGYLAWKWGIQTSLPSIHPYYSVVPYKDNQFYPTSVPGICLWLDAKARNTLTLSGNNVTAWKDLTGNTNLTCANNYPTYITLNGYPCLSFLNGSNTYPGFVSSSTSLYDGTTSLYVFSILNLNSSPTADNPSHFGIGNTGDVISIYASNRFVNDSSGASYNLVNAAWTYNGSKFTENSVATPKNSVILLETVFKSGFQTFYINGVAGTTRTVSLGTGTSNNVYIGNTRYNQDAFAGYMFENIVYRNVSLTNSQRQQVEGYMAWKWGIQTSLPTTHPYYSVAPYNDNTFYPSSINGLCLWLDAAETNTLTISGNNVTAWNDLTGNTNLSNTNYYPTYSANGLNGKPAISFKSYLPSGSSTFSLQYLSNSSIPSLYSSLSNFSYFIVLKQVPSNTPWSVPFAIFKNFMTYFWGTSSISSNPLFYNGGSGNNVNTDNGRSYIDNYVILLRVSVSSGNLTLKIYSAYNNNTPFTFTSAYPAGTAVSQIMYVGTSGFGDPVYTSGDGFNGLISEILFYNSNLTNTQIQQIEGYLINKWNINFQPNSIPGLCLWLDAAATHTLTLSGSNVTAWNDLTGNTNLTCANNYPTYITLNGYPCLSFLNGNASYPGFVSSPTSLYDGTTSLYVFSVLNLNSSPTADNPSHFSILNTGPVISIYDSNRFVLDNNGGSNLVNAAWTYNGSKFTINSVVTPKNSVILLETVFTSNTQTFYINGVAGTTRTVSLGTGTSNIVFIGNSGYRVDAFAGYMFENIVYRNVALTNTQIQQIEGYLAWKWGIQTSLPNTHPYYSAAPTLTSI